MTRRETLTDLCQMLMLLGIDHSSSNVCDYDLWVGDRYLLTIGNARIVVTDMFLETCGGTFNEGVIFTGLMNELFDREDLIRQFKQSC